MPATLYVSYSCKTSSSALGNICFPGSYILEGGGVQTRGGKQAREVGFNYVYWLSGIAIVTWLANQSTFLYRGGVFLSRFWIFVKGESNDKKMGILEWTIQR